MWQFKNNEELKQDISKNKIKKKKIKRKDFLIGGFFILLFQFLYHKYGFAVLQTKPKEWHETLSLIPRMILFTVLGLVFFDLINFPKVKEENIYLCIKCNSKKYNLKRNMKCQCGGEYVDMDLLKWVDDEASDKESENQQDQTSSKK